MKISVVIPTFNRSKFVLNTLEALHKQTLTDDEMEVIVVDDGSIDNTARITDDWIANCPRKNFHLISMKVNSGRAAACDTGYRCTHQRASDCWAWPWLQTISGASSKSRG